MRHSSVLVIVLVGLCVSPSAQDRGSVRRDDWGTTAGGDKVAIYTLTGRGGLIARISDFGGVIVALEVPGRQGIRTDVMLGYDDFASYERGGVYGALIGRFANRIGNNGTFPLDGRVIQLDRATPDQKVVLHSGAAGFQKRLWHAEPHDSPDPSLTLTLVSPDGDGGFPGTLTTTVTYTVTAQNALRLEYRAVSDRITVANLTNHAYFALQGEGHGDIRNQRLEVFADRYTPAAPDNLPTGELAPVANTPLDFRKPVSLSAVLDSPFEPIALRRGLDLNWVITGRAGRLRPAARLTDPDTGIAMEVSTTQPDMQIYTNNVMRATTGKGGRQYGMHSAICFETQHYPDSPNHPRFPSTVVTPSAPLHEITVYAFRLGA